MDGASRVRHVENAHAPFTSAEEDQSKQKTKNSLVLLLPLVFLYKPVSAEVFTLSDLGQRVEQRRSNTRLSRTGLRF
jgi:hypothetical protein